MLGLSGGERTSTIGYWIMMDRQIDRHPSRATKLMHSIAWVHYKCKFCQMLNLNYPKKIITDYLFQCPGCNNS